VLNDPELSVDQWKIYPCEITPWTVIKKWFEEGSYVPYPDEQLGQLLLDVLPAIPPWVRVNRVVRDIPSQVKNGNERHLVGLGGESDKGDMG
jgi:histone acetyltransferase (RNA polymerase elongator complex component)